MKIGLVLSGGGVKCAAHIGVLKVLEEENIKFDFISGTSSGSIVATLYSVGYNPEEIFNIFKKYCKKIKYFDFKNIINIIDVIMASIEIMEHELASYELEGIDYLLKIKISKISLLDSSQIDFLYNLGYEETKKKIRDIREKIYY